MVGVSSILTFETRFSFVRTPDGDGAGAVWAEEDFGGRRDRGQKEEEP